LTLNVDEGAWVRGRSDVAGYLGTRFARPYQFTAVAYTGDERRGHLAASAQCGSCTPDTRGVRRRQSGRTTHRRSRQQWRSSVAAASLAL